MTEMEPPTEYPDIHPYDELEFGDPTPVEADKGVIQGLLEDPIHVENSVPSEGVTEAGVEKQWTMPKTSIDDVTGAKDIIVQVDTTIPPAPLEGQTS